MAECVHAFFGVWLLFCVKLPKFLFARRYGVSFGCPSLSPVYICSITYPFVLSESLKPKFWVDIFPRRDVLGWLTKPSCRRWFHFLLVFFMRSCCGDRCAGIESARNGHRPYFVSRGHRGLPPLLQWLHQWSSGKDHIPLYSMWRQFRLVVLQ